MINVSKSVKKISATIELTDVSEEDYEDILLYIKTKLKKNEPDQEEKKATAKMDELYEKIDRMYTRYEDNPKNYILKQMSATEFLEAHPELGKISPVPVGRALHGIIRSHGERNYPIERKLIFSKTSQRNIQMNVFMIPVRCPTLGDKIRMFRETSRLTIKEVSEMIRYPQTVIENWEKNVYSPNKEALQKLIDIFGSDFKDEMEKHGLIAAAKRKENNEE